MSAMSRDGRARQRARRAAEPVEQRANALKERVYATFTGLAIVLVQLNNAEHLSAQRATLTLLVGIVAISAAGFVAEVIAHTAVHAAFPSGAEFGDMLRVSGGAVTSALAPLVLLGLAWIGVLRLETALRAGSIVYVVTLGVIGFLAVRRTQLRRWQQLLALALLVALGLGVVGLQQLAHGH